MLELEIGELEYDYYPDILDNQEKKEVVARLVQISTEVFDNAMNPVNPGVVDRRAVVDAGFKGLTGLKVNGKEIKTLEDILATPKLWSLYVDLFFEIQGKASLTGDELKN